MNAIKFITPLFFLLFSWAAYSQTGIHYNYGDGSGNGYTIKEYSIAYDPIQPENSSSGTYSGGEAKEVTITPKQFAQLQRKFEKALLSTDEHIKTREMGSGMLSKKEGETITTRHLARTSKTRQELEKVLKKLLE